MADLGSGDGRIVIEFAKKGIESHGFEINPFLVWISKRKIKKAGLENKAFIHKGSFWKKNFNEFNVVTIFGIDYIMKSLEKKLQKELPFNGKVISNAFKFPNWTPEIEKDYTYCYVKKHDII